MEFMQSFNASFEASIEADAKTIIKVAYNSTGKA